MGGEGLGVEFAEDGFGREIWLVDFFGDNGNGFGFSQGYFNDLAGL